MDIKKEMGNMIKDKFSAENLKPKTGKKKVLLGVIVVLLGALGLEASNNDFDLGSIFRGESMSDSKLQRDSKGNVMTDTNGNMMTKIMRDKMGNITTDGSGKLENEYNCADFSTQVEAQGFYEKAGGIKGDVNRLDGDKNGVACQDLPKGKK
jgi:hypothetical protein